MFVKRLCDNVEGELHTITDKGINLENLDVAYKLMDIYKNCKKVMAMSEPVESKSEYVTQLEGIMQNASAEEWEMVKSYLAQK